MSAGFGAMSPELFARHDRDDCFLKTSEASFLQMMGAPMHRFSETWLKSGLMCGGEVFRLADLVPVMDATEFSMWPTPTTTMIKGAGQNSAREDGQPRTDRLDYAMNNWSTPIANDAEKRGIVLVSGLAGEATDFLSRRHGLMTMLTGAKSSNSFPRLSPQFTEWLMGLPVGWTDYECAETGFSHWQRRMRGWLDRLHLPPQLQRIEGLA
ncbi:MAG: hypothetical protein AAF317_00090 [Pseudomonadota bacterium]